VPQTFPYEQAYTSYEDHMKIDYAGTSREHGARLSVKYPSDACRRVARVVADRVWKPAALPRAVFTCANNTINALTDFCDMIYIS
jgi:hypothetical protein